MASLQMELRYRLFGITLPGIRKRSLLGAKYSFQPGTVYWIEYAPKTGYFEWTTEVVPWRLKPRGEYLGSIFASRTTGGPATSDARN